MRIFINYAREDVEEVQELVELLRERGHKPWFDADEIMMGQNYQARILQAVAHTPVFLTVVSPHALESERCLEYLKEARSYDHVIMPVKLADVPELPAEYREYHMYDLSGGLSGEPLAALLKALDMLKVKPDTVPADPADPDNDAPTLLNDLAEGPDGLGFRDYAMAFAHVMTSPNIRPPMTIGIYGPWGTGKTFLMHRIMREIDRIEKQKTRKWWPWQRQQEDKNAIRVLQVDFDAWAYNTTDVLWVGLVQKIFKKIEDQLNFVERMAFTLRRNVAKSGWMLLRRFVYFLLFFGAIGITLFLILDQLDLDILAGLVPFLGLPFLVRILRDATVLFATPQSRQIATVIAGTTRVRSERRFLTNLVEDQQTGSMARVYEDMDKMLDALPPNTRLAIYIDDLDRCKPERVMEVLEAINLLLAFKEFIVFLAIDTRIVTQIIESNYAETLHGIGTGYEYLDKIVQIPFSIPRATGRDLLNYINKLIEAPPGEEDVWTFERTTRVARITFSSQSAPQYDLTAAMVKESKRDDELETKEASYQANIADIGYMEMTNDADEEMPELTGPVPMVNVSFNYAERCVFRAFSPFLDPNPRRIKRLINVYRLVRILAERKEIALFKADPAKVILWLILGQQWPHATAMMLDWMHTHSPRDPVNLEQVYEKVADVLDDPELGQRHDEMDYDNHTLDMLMARYGAYLTNQDIAILQGLTLNFHPKMAREFREFFD